MRIDNLYVAVAVEQEFNSEFKIPLSVKVVQSRFLENRRFGFSG